MIDRERQSGGFTVAELIVAMSISAITLLSGYEFFGALKTAGDRQSEDLAITAGIVHGLDRICEDLLHAVPRAESREPIFAGSNPTLDDQVQTIAVLGFYSLCTRSGEDWTRGLRHMCQVSYELTKVEDSFCLYRNATSVVGAGPASNRELILDGVEQMQITFHNGQKSEPSFSSNEKLPAGVELLVTFHGQVWPLSVRLPCGSMEGQP